MERAQAADDRDVMSLLEYVNELCSELCEVITSSVSKIYNQGGTPSSNGTGSQTNTALYEPLKKHGKLYNEKLTFCIRVKAITCSCTSIVYIVKKHVFKLIGNIFEASAS